MLSMSIGRAGVGRGCCGWGCCGRGGAEFVRAPRNQWLWDDHVSRCASPEILKCSIDGQKYGCKLVGPRDCMMLAR